MVEIEQMLAQTLGLDLASVGAGAVHRAVHSRMTQCGVHSTDAYLARLSNDPGELQELIERLIVPETWFFRNPEALGALADLVTREWLPRHSQGALHVLSVPCSTGEEPYSIAITLAEAGLVRNQVRIDAVDISRQALAYAERGVYGSKSFRDDATRARRQYWHTVSGGVEVTLTVRDWVTFSHGNLVSPQFRPPTSRYDVIFCRNVLIYFERSVQEHVLDTLHDLLAPDGFLFVGPAEAMLAGERGFLAAGYRMAFGFRKGARPTQKDMSLPARTAALALTQPRRPPAPARSRPRVVLSQPVPAVTAPPRVSDAVTAANELDTARRLADAGRLAEAAHVCESYVRQWPMSAAGWCLAGLVHGAMGEPDRAAEFYRKALFLEPEHPEALMHLSMFARERGDVVNADRLRARARGADRDVAQDSLARKR